MHAALTPLALGALVALAGCSTPASPPPAASPAAAAPALAAQEDQHEMTGSRIPKRKSTDRMLKTVGGQEARDAMDSAPRPLDSNRAY
ncbi:hypothetical protein [Telluria beijingensis]|uniref:hypothetical protein n=1 Tax=Telluria beijingensis TaxID=3068633 RepID=UPI0027957AD3|nr:hypothetical protein [Massilia sp. REN29]